MSPSDDRTHSENRFDLLVDGELSNDERRRLLSRLDEEPGGWRACAMAFLEAQAWKQDLSALLTGTRRPTAEAGPQPTDEPPLPNPLGAQRTDSRLPRRSSLVHKIGTVAAMAASFVFALFLGSWWQRESLSSRRAGDASAVQLVDSASQLKQPPSPWSRAAMPGSMAPRSSGSDASAWHLVAEDGSIQLPVEERNQIDGDWLDHLPSAIPPQVLQQLERTGHEIRRHRGVVPLQMQDGRRLVVPVDQFDIHYIGRPAL